MILSYIAIAGTPEKPAPEKKGEVKTPALKAFGRDLTDIARKGEMDPVIGRKSEIERVIQILCRRTKNNPVLLGEAGVGKTAIVEGLAQEISAELLVTACPTCKTSFERHTYKLDSLETVDITELVAQAL